MALKQIEPITPQQMDAKGVVSAPTVLTGTPEKNKAIFDRMARELMAPVINQVIADHNEIIANEQARETAEASREQAESERRETVGALVQAAEVARDGAVAAQTAAEQAQQGAEAAQAGAEAAAARFARTARVVVGTSTAGWTEYDCDYLCDGSGDEVEINTAIADAAEHGGEVVLLDGVYALTPGVGITLDKPVTISGSGHGTVLDREYDAGGLFRVTCGGCTIREMSLLNGSGGKAKAMVEIDIQSAVQSTARPVHVYGLYIDNEDGCGGLRITDSKFVDCNIVGNTFRHCFNSGLVVAGTGASNIVISGNVFDFDADLTVSNSGSHNISVIGNIFTHSEIDLSGRDSSFIGNCVFNDEEEGYCVIVSGTGWTVTGNTLSHSVDEDEGTPLIVTGSDNMICGNNLFGRAVENTGADNVIIQGESLVNGGTVGGTLRTKDVFVGGFTPGGVPTGEKSSLRVNGTLEAFGETKLHESVSADKDMKVGASLTVDGTARTNGNLETHNVKPRATGTYSLGNESKWFKRAYIQTAIIHDVKTETVGEDGSVETVSLLERIAALERKVAELEGLDSLDAFVDELIDGAGGEPDADG